MTIQAQQINAKAVIAIFFNRILLIYAYARITVNNYHRINLIIVGTQSIIWFVWLKKMLIVMNI